MDNLDLTSLLTGKNLLLTGGVFALTTAIREVFKVFFASASGQRILPVIPLIFGVAGALAGVCDGVVEWQGRLMLGLIAGFAAGHLFKIGKTTFMGSGVEDPEPPSTPPSPPSTPPSPTVEVGK